MTTLPRRMDWPERLAVVALVAATASLFVFGGVLSAMLLILCAFMGWTRVIEQAEEQSKAKGGHTISGKARVVIVAVLLVLAFVFLPRGDRAASAPEKVVDAKAEQAVCPSGSQPTTVDFSVAEDEVLRASPDAKAATVQKAIGKEMVDVSLETGGTVRQLCKTGRWSKVRILTTPAEFQALNGWVPTTTLRKVPVTAQGRRIYKAADFDWPAGSKSTREALVAVMNRIMTDNPECDAMDTDNLVANRSGGTVAYSVPCWSAGDLRSFDFTAADAKSGRSFAPVEPIKKLDAISACKEGVLRKAVHPSTVEFPTFDYDFRDGGNGKTQVLMSATAKNGFNLDLRFDVQCDFTGANLDSVSMSEAAR